MNKLLLGMILFAVAFWGLFVAKLIQRIPTGSGQSSMEEATQLPSLDDLAGWMKPQPLPPKDLRDPFRLTSLPTAKSATKAVAAMQPPSKPTEKPAIEIDAILPGDNPVAILRHKGETAVVRVGQSVWGVTVHAVGPDRVTIQYEGALFELQK